MAALTQGQIDLEINKNILDRFGKKASNFLESINRPADKVAPNIYGSNNISSDPVLKQMNAQTPNNVGLDIKPKVNLVPASTTLKQLASQTPSQSQSQPQNFKSVLDNGITYEGDMQGNRKYTMGTPGQDGYGSMIVKPRTGMNQPILQNINQPGQRTAEVGGMTITGAQSDINKFSKPVGGGSQMVPTGRMIQAISTSDYLPKEQTGQQLPKYLGPESGLGWQTRAKLYNDQMDTYNKTMGNQTALDIESMREAGAGQRTLAQANQWNTENELNAKKIGGDLALADTQNKVGQLALLQEQNLQAAKSAYINNPNDENKLKLNTLLYDPRKPQQQPDVKVIDKYDPITGNKIGQTVVRDDGTGNYVDAMKPQQPQEHPAIAFLRKNDTPENRAQFIKRYKKLPEGF